MSTVAVIGDVHLGRSINLGKPGIGNALNSKIVDQINILNWILDQSVDNDVDIMVFTGDIFHDVKPDFRLVNFFIEFLKTCEINNIDVYIIAGNHDIKRTGSNSISVLDIITSADLPMAHVYKSMTTIYFNDVSITLMPFRDRSFLDCTTNTDAIDRLANQLVYESASIPSHHDKILIGHLSIEGSIYFGDEYDNISNELMCPINMFSDYDYVWMGHVHKPQVLCKKPYVAHIGSIDISDFGEKNQSKHIVIFNTKSKKKIKKLTLPTRKLHHILIEIDIDEDPTLCTLQVIKFFNKKTKIDGGIVRIDVNLLDPDADNLDRDKIESLVYSLGAFYICSISESKSAAVVSINNQNIVDNDIAPKEAIKLFAEQEDFKSEKEKLEYIDMANSIIDRYYDS